eukprot:COSAG02_NODE_6152_length_3764_cov_1.306328_3_plen_79_part_00
MHSVEFDCSELERDIAVGADYQRRAQLSIPLGRWCVEETLSRVCRDWGDEAGVLRWPILVHSASFHMWCTLYPIYSNE